MSERNEHFVIAVFENEAAAGAARINMEGWDLATEAVALGHIGTITKHKGKIKVDAGRKTAKGAKAGIAVGVIAGVLTGGVGLIGGAILGGVLGSGGGALFKKHLDLSDEQIAELNADLDNGHVALVVNCDEFEMDGVAANLGESGGKVLTFSVPQEVVQQAADEADQAGAPAEGDA